MPPGADFALSLLPMAAELKGSPYGLDCGACPRQHRCNEWPDAELVSVWGGDIVPPANSRIPEDWGGRCPASWLAHPEVAAASHLLAQSKVSSLAHWPDGYAAWAVDATVELQQAFDALQAQRVQEQMSRR